MSFLENLLRFLKHEQLYRGLSVQYGWFYDSLPGSLILPGSGGQKSEKLFPGSDKTFGQLHLVIHSGFTVDTICVSLYCGKTDIQFFSDLRLRKPSRI